MAAGNRSQAPIETATPAVVATAGHVDHGKSSLILRLTGTDPDRLKEEKRRGLTIELGYAWCTLPSGREIAFVDVPGHERFVRTMLAGVGPVRLVLFVVAADEGWKPQSEEHLEIVDVLGVDGAVVALTKRDLVDVSELDRVRDAVSERIRGTALEPAPVIACSSSSSEGLEDLVAALDAMVAAAPDPARDERPRQHVDRVFSMKGAGTVVTGTLTGGPITVGEEVELLPSGVRARVRGLQTHRRSVEVAQPGSRMAANLTGTERASLARGEVLTRPGLWAVTDVLDARLRPVRSLARPLGARGAFKLHAGSAERDARIRLYDVKEVAPEGAFARITLSAPLVLDVGDRFVLRESGRRETVAGGTVLDTDPPRRPGPGAADRLSARERAERSELPALLVAERGAVRAQQIELAFGTAPNAVANAVRAGAWWIGEDVLERVGVSVRKELAAFHEAEPFETGLDVTALRRSIVEGFATGLRREADLAEAVIDALAADGVIARDGATVRLTSHRTSGPSETESRLVDAVRSGEPTPPTIAELLAEGFTRSSIDAAVRSGELVRISPELVLSRAFVERAGDAVREAGERGITVSALRQRLGTSRKYAVPLLEHMDRAGITRRSGDLRFSRAGRPGP